ncbi:hypothetical protein Dform_00843 [Dehalogenimonas formicexedens]|uniref:Uncharacterized protein n=1 Tax=Dehalogenimonas formicexedens TaxID=1839801 RepID=A0A1P8F6W6_9CHLR|nr:hypothetical protein [Dehalogenimonas formicexedens]APV44188.1 hypothetical protein Dform_00843 [Dehalogenimonas formicexedens]
MKQDFRLDNAEYIESEAGNIGLRCKCGAGAGKVVYIVTARIPPARNPITRRECASIETGAYCYRCLKAAVLGAGRIPTPMSEDLYDKLRADLTGTLYPGRPLKTLITI